MRTWYAMSALAAATLGGCATAPHSPLREATGATAQTVCNAAFVSGLDPAKTLRSELHAEPGMAWVDWALHSSIDRRERRVSASLLGGSRARSVYRAGRGCTLIFGPGALPDALRPVTAPPQSAAHVPVVPADHRIAAAINAAFAEPEHGAARATQAIVIVHHGRIIGERYARGITAQTALNSHSLAKSVVNALVGILVRQGRLRLDQTVPIAASGAATPVGPPVTVEQLLRMNAGFGFDEGIGASISSRIWYEAPDTAQASAHSIAAARRSPGWGYCNRCYMILSKLVGTTVGGGPQGIRDFAERELFGPLGMEHVVPEFDQAGTLMGSNAIFASPRDFARFGLLYLNDGAVGGRRILPEGWVEMSSRATPGTGYGAGFWLNTTQTPMPNWPIPWGLPTAPSDAYFARGHLGQYIVIVPSRDLVVVRMGQSHGRGMEIDGVGHLLAEIVRALGAP